MKSKAKVKNNLKNFLAVKNSTETSADLYFYGDIVSEWWAKLVDDEARYPAEIRDFLDGQKGKALNVYINSGGGSVFAGMAIYNMLKRHEGKVTVHVDGMAASIASVIALAGDEIIIPSNAYMFVHKPEAATWGNADDMREMAEALDRIQDGIVAVYAEHLKNPDDRDSVIEKVNAGTWMTGAEAAELFDIKVSEAAEYAASVTDLTRSYHNIPEEVLQSVDKTDEKKENLKRLCLQGITK
ncbi:MAG: Clp protease ClpP [Clostridia bacterium]|nr:Clp protease ClpP [Clostridia bacterium]